MKYGDKAVGVIHRTCLRVGHVRLTGNYQVNGRAASAAEVEVDGVTGIRITVFVERQIARECDVSLLEGGEG